MSDLLKDCGADAQSHAVEIVDGVERFVPDLVIEAIMNNPRTRPDLNEIWITLAPFLSRRATKREAQLSLRRFYRDMGYTLCGYLEIFGHQLDEEKRDTRKESRNA